MIMNILETKDLVKIYKKSLGRGEVTALKNLNLSVPKGTIFGLLGPNGAGKTTLIKIILGIAKATSGSVSVLNSTPSDYKVRKRIGYLPENHKFPEYLVGEEFMKFTGELYGLSGKELEMRIDSSLEIVKMNKWRKTKLRRYSKGMLQRIGLAQALMHEPELIFLDEPTDGVDPIGRKEIREVLKLLKENGRTIFLNSHLLSEVELISDRIAILNEGSLVFEGKVDELTSDKNSYEIIVGSPIDDLLDNELKMYRICASGENLYVVSLNDGQDINSVIDAIRSKGISIKSFAPVRISLEDKFINLIDRIDEE